MRETVKKYRMVGVKELKNENLKVDSFQTKTYIWYILSKLDKDQLWYKILSLMRVKHNSIVTKNKKLPFSCLFSFFVSLFRMFKAKVEVDYLKFFIKMKWIYSKQIEKTVSVHIFNVIVYKSSNFKIC